MLTQTFIEINTKFHNESYFYLSTYFFKSSKNYVEDWFYENTTLWVKLQQQRLLILISRCFFDIFWKFFKVTTNKTQLKEKITMDIMVIFLNSFSLGQLTLHMMFKAI